MKKSFRKHHVSRALRLWRALWGRHNCRWSARECKRRGVAQNSELLALGGSLTR